ncbi:MAG: DUF4249 domain-containing protein, partial [Fulvivirga sp.]|nr:DUF4249 domain-containing protein [Fulvivirga sp.]
MSKIKYILSLIVTICLAGCVDPIEVTTENADPILVVEGFIGTIPDAYEIKLSKSVRYGGAQVGFIQATTRADVIIRDSQGNTTFLTEIEDGSYFTPPDFAAEVGETYTLLINTAEGESYTSTPQLTKPAPEIENLRAEYKEVPFVNDFNQVENKTGVEVFMEFTDNSENQDFYFISYEGVFPINTRPDLHEIKNS